MVLPQKITVLTLDLISFPSCSSEQANVNHTELSETEFPPRWCANVPQRELTSGAPARPCMMSCACARKHIIAQCMRARPNTTTESGRESSNLTPLSLATLSPYLAPTLETPRRHLSDVCARAPSSTCARLRVHMCVCILIASLCFPFPSPTPLQSLADGRQNHHHHNNHSKHVSPKQETSPPQPATRGRITRQKRCTQPPPPQEEEQKDTAPPQEAPIKLGVKVRLREAAHWVMFLWVKL